MGIGVALALVGAACAYPTLTGPTGYAVIPTAMAGDSGLTIAADAVDQEVGKSYPLRAVISVGTAEVGAFFDEFNDEFPLEEAWGANGKVKIANFLSGSAALGAQFRREKSTVLGVEVEDDYSQGYFAWTSDFGGSSDVSSFELTWGANWTQFQPDVGGSVDGVRGFAGVHVGITNDIALIGEYQSDEPELGDADPITTATIRFNFSPGFSAQVGTTNALGLIGMPDQHVFAGAMLKF
jgi:hypothetical protein